MKSTNPAPFHSATTNGCIACAGKGKSILQIHLLEDWLVRVSFLPDGLWRLDRTWMIQGTQPDSPEAMPREGRTRDDVSVFTCPEADITLKDGAVHLHSKQLALELDMERGCITWKNISETVFARDVADRGYVFDSNGTRVSHYLERWPDEYYYGFGERTGPLDKKGLRMEMRNLDALGYDSKSTDPLYKHWPIYITWLPEKGIAYALIYDNLSDTVFDMGKEIDAYHGDYRSYQAAGGDIDYYLVYGPDLVQLVKKISQLIGRIQLPPKWALGYMGSGMGYTDSPNIVYRLGDFIQECETNRIPCDMFHLSSGYSMNNSGKRWVFHWNRQRIPDPPVIAQTFHNSGMKVCANIKPCLLDSHPEYADAARKGIFLKDEDGPHLAKFWGGNGSYIDFTSHQGYHWWQEKVTSQILQNGIDSTWNDNNEYELWDDSILCQGFGNPILNYLVRPLHSFLMTRASWEAQLAHSPDQRPFVLSRSGCPGIQRYAQSWSGDNSTSWQSMKYNIPMGLGLSLSGQPNIGHDVGGFLGKAPSPELFVRWVQNGIFHPRFSIHSWRTDGTASEPWMYPEVLDEIRAAIEFRYQLLPYLYSLFCDAAITGTPIIRPMVYEFPEDPASAAESFDFMLGWGLLVATVFEEAKRTRNVQTPIGNRWCDYYTGFWYRGGQNIELPAPLERPTLLARAGAVIPLGRVMPRVSAHYDDYRALYVFPDPDIGSGSFDLIEDDGESNRYLTGARTILGIHVSSSNAAIELKIQAKQNGYTLPYSSIDILLPPGEARPVSTPGFIEKDTDAHGRRVLSYRLPEGIPHEH